MSTPWDQHLAGLLNELSTVQGDLLELLNEKRELLLAADVAGLAALEEREQQIIERLTAAQQDRATLLTQAGDEGMPSDSIRSLARALPRSQRDQLDGALRDSAARAQLLRHKSLTNWVVVQRTLIHLSQLLEIIATGGRLQPTYGNGQDAAQTLEPSGAMVDQAA